MRVIAKETVRCYLIGDNCQGIVLETAVKTG